MTKSSPCLEVQAILAELLLANSSIAFSTCLSPLSPYCAVAGVQAAKQVQSSRTGTILKSFSIVPSKLSVLLDAETWRGEAGPQTRRNCQKMPKLAKIAEIERQRFTTD